MKKQNLDIDPEWIAMMAHRPIGPDFCVIEDFHNYLREPHASMTAEQILALSRRGGFPLYMTINGSRNRKLFRRFDILLWAIAQYGAKSREVAALRKAGFREPREQARPLFGRPIND